MTKLADESSRCPNCDEDELDGDRCMTLADELERLAKDATPGPWGFDGTFSDSNYIGTADADIFMHNSWPLEQESEAAANVRIVLALQNNLATIITALRQPDAVPGDLVDRLQHCSQNTDDEYLHELTGRAAAAIQSLTAENATLLFKCREAEEGWKNALIAPLTWQAELTAERDALQQALADAQGAMTLTAEIGVTYFDQRNEALAERDAALARVAELEAGLAAINAGALNDRENDKNFRYFAERKTRALLEGSKP